MTVLILLLIAPLLISLVLATPLILGLFHVTDDRKWQRLSDVGQTYGAASAILSMVALGGVAVSLLLQNRETKAAREQALRALHVELVRLALEDPALLGVWGPFSGSTSVERRRQHMYTNLIVSHWQMMWEVGGLSERHLRVLAQELFAGVAGRRFWSLMGDVRTSVEGNRRTRRFHHIMADEYDDALGRGPAVVSQDEPAALTDPPDAVPSIPQQRPAVDPVACLLALSAAAIGMAVVLRRRRRW